MRAKIGRRTMRLLLYCFVLLCLGPLSATTQGGGPDFYGEVTERLAHQSFQKWERASAGNASAHIRFSQGMDMVEARERILQEYLSQLVPAMKLSPEVEHIPKEWPVSIDTTTPEKKWIGYYAEVKNKLRPEVKYEWTSSATVGKTFVTLSKEHVDTLRGNLDVMMWYRNELDSKSSENHDLGAQHFKIFLDYIIAGIIEGLPSSPEIDMDSGLMSVPEWKLDEKALREQLAMTYRYLNAKYMTYPQYDEFGPADRELLFSLMKTAYLMGIRMEFEWMEEMDVSLNRVTSTTMWKEPIRKAFEVMQAKEREEYEADIADDETLQSQYYDEQPCLITIPPPKPKAKPKPSAKPKEEGQRIEIIIRPKD
jgi:hypothetical protein